MIEGLLGQYLMHPEGLTIWLALWGEVAVNPHLRAEHLRHYRAYRTALAQAAARQSGRDTPDASDDALAAALIALLDGIWLESCIAPGEMTLQKARVAVETLLAGAGRPAG